MYYWCIQEGKQFFLQVSPKPMWYNLICFSANQVAINNITNKNKTTEHMIFFLSNVDKYLKNDWSQALFVPVGNKFHTTMKGYEIIRYYMKIIIGL